MKRIWRNKLKVFAVFLALFIVYFYAGYAKPVDMEWGVTFSPAYAESFGQPWPKVYLEILDDLKVDHIRLPAYWSEYEPEEGQYSFAPLDFMIQEAALRDVSIILGVGRRLPRWPECHVPNWAKDLPEHKQQEKLLQFIPIVIERYREVPQIKMWQVENEFFLRNFGECPNASSELLDRELAIVRSMDDRPILLTDSGELGGWVGTMRRADVFGTTMYRIIYNEMYGFMKYPLKPVFYIRRFLMFKPFFKDKAIINVELQAEPWAKTTLWEDSLDVKFKSLSPEQFEDNLNFARSSGISPAYLWGAEWWYFVKEELGEDRYWEIAKELWQNK